MLMLMLVALSSLIGCKPKIDVGLQPTGDEIDTEVKVPDDTPHKEEPDGGVSNRDPIPEHLDPSSIKTGNDYLVSTICELHMQAGGNTPIAYLDAGEVVTALEVLKRDDYDLHWAQVCVGDTIGWIPTWYLVDSVEKLLLESEPVFMVVREEAYLQPLPYPWTRSTLRQGQVVRVVTSYEAWSYVQVIQYEYSSAYGWVLTTALELFRPETSREGLVREGAPLYALGDNGPDLKSYSVDRELTVFIKEQKGDYARVIAPGGMDRWVLLEDIISYNPWKK